MTTCTINTDITKILKVCRSIANFWIEENQLANVLEVLDDDNVVTNKLKYALDCCKNLGESHARGVLRSTGIKVKQNLLQNMLMRTKGALPLGMRLTQRRRHVNCSANTV